MASSSRAYLAVLLGLIFLIGIGGCRAPGGAIARPLPLSVALIPASVAEGKRGALEDARRLELPVEVDPVTMNRRLVEVLEESCFSRVIVTDRERSDSGEVPADLVLECQVEYSPEIYTRGGSFFYVNIFMHMIGGPLCYFVKDRSYLSPAEIVLHVHDTEKMINDDATLADRQARLLYASSRFDEIELSFNERNERVGNYLLSLLVPVGFMAHETDKVRERVESEVVEALARGIADEIQRKREEILLPDTLSARFYVDPATIEARYVAGSRIRLEGDVLHQPGPRQERLDRFEIRVGDRREEFAFGASRLDEEMGSTARPFYRYGIVAEVGAAEGVESVRVRIWDTDDNQRWFTVRVGKGAR